MPWVIVLESTLHATGDMLPSSSGTLCGRLDDVFFLQGKAGETLPRALGVEAEVHASMDR